METIEYESFQVFERREYILTNYICGNLNSDYSPNRGYYCKQYNYVSKLKIICMWKQIYVLPTVSCKGEAICNDQLANFFEYKEHKNYSCSTV